MIELGKKYQTRDGRPVRILCVDGPDPAFPIVGYEEGNPNVLVWTADGKYNPDVSQHADLVPVTEKHHGYVIISKDVSPAILGNIVWNMHQAAEGRRLAAAFPESWIVAPVDWET